MTITEALQYVKQFRCYVKSRSRGIPLTFNLCSMETILKLCNVQLNSEDICLVFVPVTSHTVTTCVTHFEMLRELQFKVNQMHVDFNTHDDYISDTIITTINNIHEANENAVRQFKNNFKNWIVSYRSNTQCDFDMNVSVSSVIDELLDQLQNEIHKYIIHKNNITRILDTMQRGVTYVGKHQTLDLTVNDNVYVLHVNEHYTSDNDDTCLDILTRYLLRLQYTYDNTSNVTCIYHDCSTITSNYELIKLYMSGEEVHKISKESAVAFDNNLVKVGECETVVEQKDGVLLTIKCPKCLCSTEDQSNTQIDTLT